MPKFEVQIFGTVPDCIQIEAEDEDAACDRAIDAVMGILDFEAELADPEKPKCDKSDKSARKRTKA